MAAFRQVLLWPAVAAAAALALAASGCGGGGRPGGSGAAPARLDPGDQARARSAVARLSDLPPGWRARGPAVSVTWLGPSLSGLTVRGQAESFALVRKGDLVRSSATVLGTADDAAEALERARTAEFPRVLGGRFGSEDAAGLPLGGLEEAVGYRVRAPRPAEPGEDTAEVVVIRRGRALAIVELVSRAGFDVRTRDRLLGRIAARLDEVSR